MNYKLIIFDLDGTLVRGVGFDAPKIPNRWEEQEFIPGVIERCEQLRAEGITLAIASNQGGVAFGFCSLQEASFRVEQSARAIGAKWWRICPYHEKGTIPEFAYPSYDRKPEAGMLFDIMEECRVLEEETLFVGDMDTDKQAARNAGIDFQWAKDFFGWDNEQRNS